MWSLSVYMLSRVQLFVTPWTVAHQAPLSMGSPQARILDWMPFPSPGDLLNPGIKPTSPVSFTGRQIPYHYAA